MSRRSNRILKTLLRWAFGALVFTIIGILLWRITFSGDPTDISTLLVNDRTADAYEQYGDGWTLYSQGQSTMTNATYEGEAGVDHKFTNKNNYGYFGVTQSVMIREAKQVQIVFRYNNSTIKHLKEDYALEQMPAREDHLYDVTLVLAIDRTPEDSSDNLSTTLNPESVQLLRVQADGEMTVRATKNLYNYYRYVFDLPEDLNMDHVLAIYVDVYYVGDITYLEADSDIYTDEPYGTLCIYDHITATKPYELTSADKKALEAAR